MPIV
jgi:hypothetical protein